MDQFEGGGDAVGLGTKDGDMAEISEQSKTVVEKDMTVAGDKENSGNAVEGVTEDVKTMEEEVKIAGVPMAGAEIEVRECVEDSEAALVTQPQPGSKEVSESGSKELSELGANQVSEPCPKDSQQGISREESGIGQSADGGLTDADVSVVNQEDGSADPAEGKHIETVVVTEEVKAAESLPSTKPNDQKTEVNQVTEAEATGMEPEKKLDDGPTTDKDTTNSSDSNIQAAELPRDPLTGMGDSTLVTKELVLQQEPGKIEVTVSAEKPEEKLENRIGEAEDVVTVNNLKMDIAEKVDPLVQEEVPSNSSEKERETAVAEKIRKERIRMNPDNGLLKAILKRSAQQVLEHDLKMGIAAEDELQPVGENVTTSPQKKVKTDAEGISGEDVDMVSEQQALSKLDSEEREKGSAVVVKANETVSPDADEMEAKSVSTRLAADFSAGVAEDGDQDATVTNNHFDSDAEKPKFLQHPSSVEVAAKNGLASTVVNVAESVESNIDMKTNSNFGEDGINSVATNNNTLLPIGLDKIQMKTETTMSMEGRVGYSENDPALVYSDGPSVSSEVASDEWEPLPQQPGVSVASGYHETLAEKFAGHAQVKFSGFSKQVAPPPPVENWDEPIRTHVTTPGPKDNDEPIRTHVTTPGPKDNERSYDASKDFKQWIIDCQNEKLESPEILWGLTSRTIGTETAKNRWAAVQVLKWMQEKMNAEISYRVTVLDDRAAVIVAKLKKEDLTPTRYLVDVRVSLQNPYHRFFGKALSDSKVLAFNVASSYIVQKMIELNSGQRVMPRLPWADIPFVLQYKMEVFENLVEQQRHYGDRFQVVDGMEEMDGRTWYVCTISYVNKEGKRSNCKRCGFTKDLAKVSAALAVFGKLGQSFASLKKYRYKTERFDRFRGLEVKMNLEFASLNLESVQIPATADSTVMKGSKPAEHWNATEGLPYSTSLKTATFQPRKPYGSDYGTSSWGPATPVNRTVDEEDWVSSESKSCNNDFATASNVQIGGSWRELKIQPCPQTNAYGNLNDLESQSSRFHTSSSPVARSDSDKANEWDNWNLPSDLNSTGCEVQPVLGAVEDVGPVVSHSTPVDTCCKARLSANDEATDGFDRVFKDSKLKLCNNVFRDAPIAPSLNSVEMGTSDHKAEWEAAKVPAEAESCTTQVLESVASRVLNEPEEQSTASVDGNSPSGSKGLDVSITIEIEEEDPLSEPALVQAHPRAVPTESVDVNIAGSDPLGSSSLQESTDTTLMQVAAQVTLHMSQDSTNSTVNSALANTADDYECLTPISLIVNADSDDVAKLSDCATMMEDVVDAGRVPEYHNLDSLESLEDRGKSIGPHLGCNLSLGTEDAKEGTILTRSSTTDNEEDQILNFGFLQDTCDGGEAESGDPSAGDMQTQDYSFGTPNAQSSSMDLNPTMPGSKQASETQDFSCQCNFELIPAPTVVTPSQVPTASSASLAVACVNICSMFVAFGVLAEAKDCLEEARRLNQARDQ